MAKERGGFRAVVMSAVPARKTIPYTEVERIREGREILRAAAVALEETAERLDDEFDRAVTLLAGWRGEWLSVGSARLAGLAQVGRDLSSTGPERDSCIRSKPCMAISAAWIGATWCCCCPTAASRRKSRRFAAGG
ncbi:MAG: hypothetical protein CM1200mP2_35440 [Planctomycetaceae bacterium]|nr:MAG: hypothetical protein CM1200mP2_35440 [Planctomycetaceae bacterium]